MNRTTWQIRQAVPSDIDALVAVDQSAFELFGTVDFEGFLTVDAPGEEDRLNLQKGIERGTLRVATVEDKVVGYIDFRPCDGGLYIVELSVHQDYGQRGIGRGLMENASEYAVAEGHPFVCLTTFTHLKWNRPFYEKLGFEVIPFNSIGADFTSIFEQQAQSLDRTKRVAMRLDL